MSSHVFSSVILKILEQNYRNKEEECLHLFREWKFSQFIYYSCTHIEPRPELQTYSGPIHAKHTNGET